MSAASGVRLSDALRRELGGMRAAGVGALVVRVEGPEMVAAGSVRRSPGGWAGALDGVRVMATAPCFVVVPKDGKGALVVSLVPDSAGVRDKMVYSSSASELRQAVAGALGGTEDYFVTDAADLSRAAYERRKAVKGPLTFFEEQRKQETAHGAVGMGLLAAVSGKPASQKPAPHILNGGGRGARPSRAFTEPPGNRAAAASAAAAGAGGAPKPRETRDDSMAGGPGVAALMAKFQQQNE